jgi:outer membrane murein-binding lipoprotein Lpp
MQHLRSFMRKYKQILAAVALSTLMVTGCASKVSNAYPAATHSYNVAGAAYKTATTKLQNLSTAGALSKANFDLANALMADERGKAKTVDADLALWQASGNQPVSYTADSKALTDAQAAVIALAGRL